MAQSVVTGAMMACTFGAAPSTLNVLPTNRVMVENKPMATIQDFIPITNIPPFVMCIAPTNPAFIAATAAKLGVATPVPCMPVTTSPWTPGSPTVMVGGIPALNSTSQCMCMWLGMITISSPGEMTISVP